MRAFITIYLLFFSLDLHSSSSSQRFTITFHDCDDGESVYNRVITTATTAYAQGRRVIFAFDVDANLLNCNPLGGVSPSSFGVRLNRDPQWQNLVYGLLYITARSCLNEPNIVNTTHSHLNTAVGELYKFSQSNRNFSGCGIHQQENFSTVMKLSKSVLIMGESPYNKAQAAHWFFTTYRLPKHPPGYTLIFSDDDPGWRAGFLQGAFSPPNFHEAHYIYYNVLAERREVTLGFLINDREKEEDCLLSPKNGQFIPFPLFDRASTPPDTSDDDADFDEIFNDKTVWRPLNDAPTEHQTPHNSVET